VWQVKQERVSIIASVAWPPALNNGFAHGPHVVECSGIDRAEPARMALVIFKGELSPAHRDNLRMHAIILVRSIQRSLRLVVQAANPDRAANAQARRHTVLRVRHYLRITRNRVGVQTQQRIVRIAIRGQVCVVLITLGFCANTRCSVVFPPAWLESPLQALVGRPAGGVCRRLYWS
jgi:hypothetical protein